MFISFSSGSFSFVSAPTRRSPPAFPTARKLSMAVTASSSGRILLISGRVHLPTLSARYSLDIAVLIKCVSSHDRDLIEHHRRTGRSVQSRLIGTDDDGGASASQP